MATQTNKTTRYQDFNANDLTFTKIEENERSKGQNIGYPRYKKDGENLLLQGPWIKLNCYGVPREGEYYKDAASRAFIKVPLDLSNTDVKAFYDKIQSIDTIMESSEFKKSQFGSKFSKYKYVPIIRIPEEDDEEEKDDKKKKYPRPPYMKVKLDVTWPETQVKTEVLTSIMKDGKREREKKVVTNVDEFATIVRYLSSIRPIIRPVKIWSEKKAKLGSDTMLYGVTFKLIKVEVEPAEGTNNLLGSENASFIDSDDESDTLTKTFPKLSSSKTSKKVEKKEEDEEEEEEEKEEKEEDDENESDEEDKPVYVPEPPKKSSSSKLKPSKKGGK